MAAYLIVNIVVRDVEKYKPYVLAAPGIIRRFGGRYLVRGGASEILEGTPQINRTVVIEFPSKQSIVDFYNDPEYQALAPFVNRVLTRKCFASRATSRPLLAN